MKEKRCKKKKKTKINLKFNTSYWNIQPVNHVSNVSIHWLDGLKRFLKVCSTNKKKKHLAKDVRERGYALAYKNLYTYGTVRYGTSVEFVCKFSSLHHRHYRHHHQQFHTHDDHCGKTVDENMMFSEEGTIEARMARQPHVFAMKKQKKKRAKKCILVGGLLPIKSVIYLCSRFSSFSYFFPFFVCLLSEMLINLLSA